MIYWLTLVAFAGLAALLFWVLLRPLLQSADRRVKQLFWGVILVVPLVSMAIYFQRGSVDEIRFLAQMQDGSADGSEEGLLQRQKQLETFTAKHPDDAEYWYLLADVRMDLQDFAGALDAFQQAADLRPDDISLHSRMAEAQFLLDGYALTGAVRDHIDRVLAENPDDTTVLGILGISAYRAQQYDAAIRFWQRSLENLPPQSPAAASIRGSIEQARMAAGAAPETEGRESRPESGDISIAVDLSLAEGIDYQASDAVFVFARQYGGPPMPIVVQRLTAGDLPTQIRLDDSSVMVEGRALADFEQIELVARLSYAGTPTPQPGDYQVVLGPLNPTQIEGPLSLQIEELVE